MTDTLKTIQTLAKIGKVMSKIAYICALVGVGVCVVSLVCLPLLGDRIVMIDGESLSQLMGMGDAEAVKIAYAYLVGWLAVCAGEAVLGRKAYVYFVNELKAGTPFTMEGAAEMKRLGIFTICIPIGSAIVSEILSGIVLGIMDLERTVDITYTADGAVALGVMFIIGALLCRHGAELAGSQDKAADAQ